MRFAHKPVLLRETIALLNPQPGEIFVDCTVGGGGHSREIAARIMPTGRLIAIDRDEAALQAARENLKPWLERIVFVKRNFAELKAILAELEVPLVDGILLDVGVSSYQLDEKERGFSYHADARLDMRMDKKSKVTARDLVNNLPEAELARILRDFGDELWAQRIARFIVARRESEGPIETTGQLVEIIKAAIPTRARRRGPHPARRTFQALRIAVNDELGALEQAVHAALDSLRPGGRLAVITFHSLEDRIVKKVLANAAAGCVCPPGLPQCACGKKPQIKMLTGKPVRAEAAELAENPRARSAKLRAAVKF
ncbi:MAG: 16S rRNA (cytosine(1402)-N(4))-methyltransferase RsmH [Firmicutes bacterium]|jgi:16S rRNA (cytosine1402-N4)-methyltransferase|nr:16S rRNA (cytosine(1402)-N(4))-methyltransferase RsmH [Bacillota bacterium]